MWFSPNALVFVDTRSAALAVYERGFSRPRLLRFGFEHFGSKANQAALFSDVLADSRESVSRLARDLKAPRSGATLLLPIGAAIPSMIDVSALRKGEAAEVDEAEVARFRLGPLLPFPIAQAEVRTETLSPVGTGAVLAQAILKATIAEAEKVMKSYGFDGASVASTLSAALRGLPPWTGAVDLVLGDSACAIAVRNDRGGIEALHLRLLLEGEDRVQRSLDEALRAAPAAREIRVLGEVAASLREVTGEVAIRPAFDEPSLRGAADPQQFPFLAVFHQGASR